jgi:hypothetical protein
MPSTTWQVAVGALIALVVGYSVVVAGSPLLGVFLAALIYLVAWLAATVVPNRDLGSDFSRTRGAATGLVAVLVLAYSLLVVGQILLGVLLVLFLVVVSWITSPRGPVADWLRRSDRWPGDAD